MTEGVPHEVLAKLANAHASGFAPQTLRQIAHLVVSRGTSGPGAPGDETPPAQLTSEPATPPCLAPPAPEYFRAYAVPFRYPDRFEFHLETEKGEHLVLPSGKVDDPGRLAELLRGRTFRDPLALFIAIVNERVVDFELFLNQLIDPGTATGAAGGTMGRWGNDDATATVVGKPTRPGSSPSSFDLLGGSREHFLQPRYQATRPMRSASRLARDSYAGSVEARGERGSGTEGRRKRPARPPATPLSPWPPLASRSPPDRCPAAPRPKPSVPARHRPGLAAQGGRPAAGAGGPSGAAAAHGPVPRLGGAGGRWCAQRRSQRRGAGTWAGAVGRRVCEHCGGTTLDLVDEVVEEKLHVVKEHQRRRRVTRATCRCRDCLERTTATSLPAPYARSKVTCDWLAWFIHQKFGLLTPLDRIRRDLAERKIPLAMGTLVNFVERAADLLAPIDGLHWQKLLAGPWMATDGTGLKVLVPGLPEAHNGYIEIYRNGEISVFQYEATKDGDSVETKLKSFRGTLTSDAEHRFNGVFKTGQVVEAGCNAHGRRKFRDAEQVQPELAKEGGAFISAMYVAEEAAKKAGLEGEELRAHRQQKIGPITRDFARWLSAVEPTLLPSDPLNAAVGYYRRHWDALTRFIDEPRAPIDCSTWLSHEQCTGVNTAS